MESVAAALARREVNLGAQLAAGALRIAAREQRHAAERLAVDHRDGPAVGDAVDAVHQIPRRHPVDDQADVAERVAANGELAVEVVGRRGGRQAPGSHAADRRERRRAGFRARGRKATCFRAPNRIRLAANLIR